MTKAVYRKYKIDDKRVLSAKYNQKEINAMVLGLIRKIHDDPAVKMLNKAEQLEPDDTKNSKKKKRASSGRACCGGGNDEEEVQLQLFHHTLLDDRGREPEGGQLSSAVIIYLYYRLQRDLFVT